MNNFLNRLKALDKDIYTAIIGMGSMGRGLFYQCHNTPGIACLAIADLDIEKCIITAKETGIEYIEVSDEKELNTAIDAGVLAITTNGHLLSNADKVEVLQEATSAIAEGAKFVISALNNKKHVVLMNAEVDLIFGSYFLQVARKNNVVCTSIDGDQYGVIKGLLDDMLLWGFELVMAGNIKGYLDLYSNPTVIIPEADKRNLDYSMCVSYTDGTKLNIEMAIIANMYKMKTDIIGMHGSKAKHVKEVLSLFDFDKIWKDNGKVPFVDYILGAEPGGGVFVVGYNKHPYQQAMLAYYKMGNGPYYLFYRPYHLCHIESAKAIAKAALDHEYFMAPEAGFQTNVFSYAKVDLKAGDTLDGLGGYMCYGKIENTDPGIKPDGLPILLADYVVLKTDIPKDQKINLSDIEYDPESYTFDLYNKALQYSKTL